MLYFAELVDHAEDLVELLLVLGHHEARVAVIDHVGHFGEVGILVDAHRSGAGRLRGQLGDDPLRPVVADDGHLAAPLEAQRDEPEREIAHPLRVAAPAGLAPDAEVLLAQRRAIGELFRIAQEQLGKGLVHAAPRYAFWTCASCWT